MKIEEKIITLEETYNLKASEIKNFGLKLNNIS